MDRRQLLILDSAMGAGSELLVRIDVQKAVERDGLPRNSCLVSATIISCKVVV